MQHEGCVDVRAKGWADADIFYLVQPALCEVDTLFVAGYWPHIALLSVLPRYNIGFWGAHGTLYDGSHEEYTTIICALNNRHEDVRKRFYEFGYLSSDGETLLFDD